MRPQSTPTVNRRRKKAPTALRGDGPCVYIYALCDPLSGEPRYIGRSIHVLTRLQQHCSESALGHTPAMKAWLAQLHAHNLEPVVEVLAHVPESVAALVESAHITAYRASGVALLNVHSVRLASMALRLGGPGVGYDAVTLRATPQTIIAADEQGCTVAAYVRRRMVQAVEDAGIAFEERIEPDA